MGAGGERGLVIFAPCPKLWVICRTSYESALPYGNAFGVQRISCTRCGNLFPGGLSG